MHPSSFFLRWRNTLCHLGMALLFWPFFFAALFPRPMKIPEIDRPRRPPFLIYWIPENCICALVQLTTFVHDLRLVGLHEEFSYQIFVIMQQMDWLSVTTLESKRVQIVSFKVPIYIQLWKKLPQVLQTLQPSTLVEEQENLQCLGLNNLQQAFTRDKPRIQTRL
jgi:hypothetical protein